MPALEGRAIYVHIVTKANRRRYDAQIQEMHRQRHDLFAVKLRWDALRRPDMMDVDAFDTDDTEYLILIDNGEPVAHLRCNPWSGRTLMGPDGPLESYVHRRDALPAPTADAAELTRYFIGRPDKKNSDTYVETSWAFMRVAQQEWAARRGVTVGLAVAEFAQYQRMLGLGWNVRALGDIVEYEAGDRIREAIAVKWRYGPDLIDATRDAYRVTSKVTFEAPAGDQPIPFSVFEAYQGVKAENRRAFLSSLSPIIGMNPPAPGSEDDDLVYLMAIETPAQIEDALSQAAFLSGRYDEPDAAAS